MKRARDCCGLPRPFTSAKGPLIDTFTGSKQLPPSPKTRHTEKGLLLHVTTTTREGGETGFRASFLVVGMAVERRVRCGRTGQAGTHSRSVRGGSARGPGPRSRPRGAGRRAMAELGDEPEVAPGSWRGWGRRRAASHLSDVAAIPYSPRPLLPIRPPTRPLAAGCCEAALPRPDRERQCLPARRSRRVSPPRSPLLASPAPRRRAQWRRRERAADPRRRVAHSTTRPRPRRPPPAPGAVRRHVR